MKTLNDIKQDVAIINGNTSWKDLLLDFHIGDHESFYDEVAKRYSNEKLQLAADSIEWNYCYDGGSHCARESHEKRIESLKDSV